MVRRAKEKVVNTLINQEMESGFSMTEPDSPGFPIPGL
ncbi:MAG: hypothetical protein Ct9H90mP4_09560 [Gammaproteobacteria bacterium]|nr:MAG: hypothetical protein Ct9H90mP4_09560 [Gammaproteobacteria bacterium]